MKPLATGSPWTLRAMAGITLLVITIAPAYATDEPGIPVRLNIPAIRVNADIESVGITSNGNMGTPKAAMNAGWLSPGIRPGETGSAFIAGHLNDQKWKPAVFARLKKLKPGDIVVTQDQFGNSSTFMVRSVKRYSVDADTRALFVSDDRQLTLVTCAGRWNRSRGVYMERLVVVAELVTH